MADTIGALALPIPVPTDDDDPVSDPFLKYALSFFQAVINAKGKAAWAAVAPGTGGLPVKKTHPYDPVDLSFIERDLPCLYMWREEGGHTEWMAEDIAVFHSKIHALWVLPPAPEERQKKRVPFINGMLKSLTTAYEIGRDPAWVVANDPDTQAATHGSVFVRWAGVSAITSPKWKRKVFIVENAEAKERYAFQSLETVLDLEEILTEDISKYSLLQGVDVTECTDAEDGVVTGVVTDHAIFT